MGSINNPGSVTVATSGIYTGNDTENRAIPHGLGAIPKLVVIYSASVPAMVMVRTNTTSLTFAQSEANSPIYDITDGNATNFYVGDMASYFISGNGMGVLYKWIAIR